MTRTRHGNTSALLRMAVVQTVAADHLLVRVVCLRPLVCMERRQNPRERGGGHSGLDRFVRARAWKLVLGNPSRILDHTRHCTVGVAILQEYPCQSVTRV